MFEAAAKLIQSKEGRQLALVIGGAVAVMTALHYYHQIKLSRLQIAKLQEEEARRKQQQA